MANPFDQFDTAPSGQNPFDQFDGPKQPSPYDTKLSADEETAFKAWKAQNAPNDSGADYDLRGAFKSSLTRDPASGHMLDTFKKPNHPTFSNESKYGRVPYAAAAQAGQWAGANHDQYVPAGQAVGTPPALPATRNTGFGAQVSQALAKSGMDPRQPVPIPTAEESRQGFKDFAVGHLQGIPATALGFLGDAGSAAAMIMPRLGLAPANVGDGRFLPTSGEVGDMMFGKPKSNLQAFGRASALEGPAVAAGLVKGTAKAAGTVASQFAPAMTEASKAGYAGGALADTFAANMRHGGAKAAEAVRMAKDALGKMYAERSAAYQQGIAATKASPTILPFNQIDDALRDASSVGVYEGKVISEGGEKVWREISNAVDDWRQGDPAKFHTAAGFDALKQRIGNIAKDQNIQPHTPASVIVDKVYDAARDTIIKNDAGYATTMKDYMEASDELREIEKSLSLGRNVTKDTSLRKLLSIFRNNANTNYGARVESGAALAKQDPKLLPALAGQELNSWMPRGIMGQVIGAGGVGASVLNPVLIPKALGALAVSSPRVLGEAAFAAGKMARPVGALLNPLKNTVLPGGGAGVPSIDPRLLAQLSPQMLNQLLLGTRTPAQQ